MRFAAQCYNSSCTLAQAIDKRVKRRRTQKSLSPPGGCAARDTARVASRKASLTVSGSNVGSEQQPEKPAQIGEKG